MLCAVYPSGWRLPASGFADTSLNKTWVLLDHGACQWEDKTSTVNLGLTNTTVSLVLRGQSGTVTYTAPFASWNCCDANTLSRASGTGPASLTLTQTDCNCLASFCATCPNCDSAGFPQAYQAINVSGFVD